ncbi:MAG: hypothetical protein AB7F98_14945 [Novosphingobium sp.]
MTERGRRLNHVEFAHRPGEGGLAVLLFEALGCSCEVIDTPPYGAYVVVSLDGSPHGENDMFASAAEPEQLALEAAMLAEGEALAGFRQLQRERPFRVNHVGLRIPTVAAIDETLARLEALASGALAGRLELGFGMERRLEEARASDTPIKQRWIWTDVISTGVLALGQQIELQAYDF